MTRRPMFESPATTRKLDRALLDDLSRMSARVQWIGPLRDRENGSADDEEAYLMATVDPRLAPLLQSFRCR